MFLSFYFLHWRYICSVCYNVGNGDETERGRDSWMFSEISGALGVVLPPSASSLARQHFLNLCVCPAMFPCCIYWQSGGHVKRLYNRGFSRGYCHHAPRRKGQNGNPKQKRWQCGHCDAEKACGRENCFVCRKNSWREFRATDAEIELN